MSAKRARRYQALDEIRRLREELEEWYATRTSEDVHLDGSPRGQYRSQLNAIHDEIAGAAKIILNDLENLDVSPATGRGQVYDRCATAERQTVWLWRVWHYFRDKFDQRRDRRYHDALAAADEVVWSCFHPFFQNPETENIGEPAPLPYIEADHSPSALRRDQAERTLKRRGREQTLVDKAFEAPIPLLKIPITALRSPWALVFIGHETGHFIQPLVAEEFAYVATFRQGIETAVGAAGGNAGDRQVWSRWADEIFADWYSILTMGQWAIWAMAQFLIGEAAFMRERQNRYPPPLVRLALMAALADHHGLPGTAILESLDLRSLENAGDSPPAVPDLGYLPAVVPAVVRPLPSGIGSLADFLSFRGKYYGDNGQVMQWSRHLREQGPAPPRNKLHSARVVAAGCARAWRQAFFARADADRAAGDVDPAAGDVAALRQASFRAMSSAAMPGVRSAGPPAAAPRPDAGRALAGLLSRADEEEL